MKSLRLSYLKKVVNCKQVLVWGISKEEGQSYKTQMEKEGFVVKVTDDVEKIPDQCNLIVTTTPSIRPLTDVKHLKKGTHITAVGSDTPEKQELDPEILKSADLTGVAVQDMAIASAVYKASLSIYPDS